MQRTSLCLITEVGLVPSYSPHNFENVFVLYVSLSVKRGEVILSASRMEVLLTCRKDVGLFLKLLRCWNWRNWQTAR